MRPAEDGPGSTPKAFGVTLGRLPRPENNFFSVMHVPKRLPAGLPGATPNAFGMLPESLCIRWKIFVIRIGASPRISNVTLAWSERVRVSRGFVSSGRVIPRFKNRKITLTRSCGFS
jgi:hypothetical protein